MKRIALSVATLMLLLCVLTGCVYIPLSKKYDFSTDEISSIAVYDMRGCEIDQSEFLITEDPAYEITDEQIEDFLCDLASIRFKDAIIIIPAAIDPSFYYGKWVVRLNYADGSFEFISNANYGEVYDKNGNRKKSHHFGCDSDVWNELIAKYVPKEIFEGSNEII